MDSGPGKNFLFIIRGPDRLDHVCFEFPSAEFSFDGISAGLDMDVFLLFAEIFFPRRFKRVLRPAQTCFIGSPRISGRGFDFLFILGNAHLRSQEKPLAGLRRAILFPLNFFLAAL